MVVPFPSSPKDQLCSMLIRAIVVEKFGMAPYWLSSKTLMIVGFTKPPSANSFCQHYSQSTATLLAVKSYIKK